MYGSKEYTATCSACQMFTQLGSALYSHNTIVAYKSFCHRKLLRQLCIKVCTVGDKYYGRTCKLSATHQHSGKEQHRKALATTRSTEICTTLAIATGVQLRVLANVVEQFVCCKKLRIAAYYLLFVLRRIRQEYKILDYAQQSIFAE